MTPKIQVKVDGSQSWYSEHIFKATVMDLNLEALVVEDQSGLHVELYRCTKVVGFKFSHFVCFILTAKTSEKDI